MKVIDMVGMEIVFEGKEWTHYSLLPCAKQAIPLLERNEQIVSWLKPSGGGVSEHIPAIRFKGKFYSLSLRMQKAIYRHIRLKKGFKNEEVMDGITKLRIPDVLLKEKIRTQSRFDAMRKASMQKEDRTAAILHEKTSASEYKTSPLSSLSMEEGGKKRKFCASSFEMEKKNDFHCNSNDNDQDNDYDIIDSGDDMNTTGSDAALPPPPPVIKTIGKKKGKKSKHEIIALNNNKDHDTENRAKRERVKTTCTVSSRMKQVVDQMIACTKEEYMIAIQQTTIFAFKTHQSEIVSCFLEKMRRENGALMSNKQALLQLVDEAYEQSQNLIRMHCPSRNCFQTQTM